MGGEYELEALYRLYYQPMYRYALVLCDGSGEAEDAVQNAFLRAMRGLERFRGDSTVKTWLFTITRRECLRLLEKRPRPEETETDVLTDAVYLENTVCSREAARIALDFIEACAEPKKSLLALRLLGEKSFAEIGAVLGKSENWCRVTFFRLKNELIVRLEGYV